MQKSPDREFFMNAAIAFLIFVLSASAAQADEHPAFSDQPVTSVKCAPGQKLTFREQTGLGMPHQMRYMAFVLAAPNEVPRQGSDLSVDQLKSMPVERLFIYSKTPGAFMGDEFPADICAADFSIELPDGDRATGILTYTEPDWTAEHHPFPYVAWLQPPHRGKVLFVLSGETIIWGLYIPEGEPGSFFLGAATYRW